MFHPWYC